MDESLLKLVKNVDKYSSKLKGDIKNVLLVTSYGSYNHGIVHDMTLYLGLKVRSANPFFLFCDDFLPLCQITKESDVTIENIYSDTVINKCLKCTKSGAKTLPKKYFDQFKMSEFINESEKNEIHEFSQNIPLEDIRSYCIDNVNIGEHTFAGALRFFARGDIDLTDSYVQKVLRKYLEGALLTKKVTENFISRQSVDIAVIHHGIYVPQGIFAEVLRLNNIKVVTYNPAYKKNCFIYSHDQSYHYTLPRESITSWVNLNLSKGQLQDLDKYLQSRRTGENDWIWFHNQPENNPNNFLKKLGVRRDLPIISLLSNVVWDAQLHYPDNVFPSMIDWVIETISYFKKRTDVQLVIRVHPAEIRGVVPSKQPLVDEIKQNFKNLPSNVFVISPENEASTYSLCEVSNGILIYNTKTGIEAAAMGKRCIVAGDAWIKNKPFSKSPKNKNEYFELLNDLPYEFDLYPFELDLARKYAYHIFFRRMIPIDLFEINDKNKIRLKCTSVRALRKNIGLGIVCNGILQGTSLTFRAENRSFLKILMFKLNMNLTESFFVGLGKKVKGLIKKTPVLKWYFPNLFLADIQKNNSFWFNKYKSNNLNSKNLKYVNSSSQNPTVLHILPLNFSYLKNENSGAPKDIINRVDFFNDFKISYDTFLITKRDSNAKIWMEIFNDKLRKLSHYKVIIIDVPNSFPITSKTIKKLAPKTKLIFRSHNAEGLHRYDSFKYSSTFSLSYKYLRMSVVGFLGDLLMVRRCDYIWPISDHDSYYYWKKLAFYKDDYKKIQTAPYFLAKDIIGKMPLNIKSFHNKDRKVLSMGIQGKYSVIIANSILGIVSAVKNLDDDLKSKWEFFISGQRSKEAENIRTIGFVDNIYDVLNTTRFSAILTDLGRGFKTKILEAIYLNNIIILTEKGFFRVPSELRPYCAYISENGIEKGVSFKNLSGILRKEYIGKDDPFDTSYNPNEVLKKRAYGVYYLSIFGEKIDHKELDKNKQMDIKAENLHIYSKNKNDLIDSDLRNQ